MIDNLIQAFGHDWVWWMLPTRPVLDINYLEKIYTIKQLKKMQDDEFEEDIFDVDKKLLALEE